LRNRGQDSTKPRGLTNFRRANIRFLGQGEAKTTNKKELSYNKRVKGAERTTRVRMGGKKKLTNRIGGEKRGRYRRRTRPSHDKAERGKAKCFGHITYVRSQLERWRVPHQKMGGGES